jgi:hypothetical protein
MDTDFYTQLNSKVTTKYYKPSKTNKTGFRGVKWHSRSNVFEAWIRVPGKKNKLYIGRSSTAEGAAIKYDEKARELFGDDAITNF